eukprot:m.242123 g.242123  ORF g.242123 m.242123 type:complete len:303 (-) comp25228_c0_seq1:54-962(-)
MDQNSFAARYVFSCFAAAVAESVTFPLDITKTRLQLQREAIAGGKQAPYRGMMGTALGIVREEGLRNLWRGLSPAVLRHMVYSGTRLGLYEQTRDRLMTGPPYPLHERILAGMGCGAIAQFLANPTDLVKVRLQMEGKRMLQGHAPRYTGTWQAFRAIAVEAGIRGLWRGAVPNMQRAALVNLGDLTTYDTAKSFFLSQNAVKLGDNTLTHALSSLCAGLVAATLGTPADVVKSRVMNQPFHDGEPTLYRGSWHCLRVTVANEGLLSLWSGFLPCWLRMAPWSLTFWLSYEQIRRASGARSF